MSVFPFVSLVSKERLLLPPCATDEYQIKGLPNGVSSVLKQDEFTWQKEKRRDPLTNCCWIEAIFHMLMRNPFIMHFVQLWDDNINVKLAISDINTELKFGSLVFHAMRVRHRFQVKEENYDQHYFEMSDKYHFIRETLKLLQPNSIYDNGMGVISTLTQFVSCVHMFIECQWSGSLYQRLVSVYTSKLWIETKNMCTNPLCRAYHKVVVEKSYKTMGACINHVVSIVLESDYALGGFINMQDSVNKTHGFNPRWRVHGASQCITCTEFAMIQSDDLLSLPMILYICMGLNSQKRRLQYDPNKMIVGPTADGQYGTYKLISSINHEGQHYTIDIRTRMDGNAFRRWNFNSVLSIPVHLETGTGTVTAIETCEAQCWQRID